MTIRERVHNVIVEAIKVVDDKTASIAPEIYSSMTYVEREENTETPLIKAGTRINWHGVLKKAAVGLWDMEQYNPDNAPNLWVDLEYRDGYRIIPSVITVPLAFSNGEIGWEGDVLYRSKKDANVYPPSVRPDDWELFEEKL